MHRLMILRSHQRGEDSPPIEFRLTRTTNCVARIAYGSISEAVRTCLVVHGLSLFGAEDPRTYKTGPREIRANGLALLFLHRLVE